MKFFMKKFFIYKTQKTNIIKIKKMTSNNISIINTANYYDLKMIKPIALNY